MQTGRTERRRHRLGAPLQVAAATLLATGLLRLHDPHTSGSYGFCPVLLLTGWNCPACGGLRAVNDLTHGELGAAAHSNLLLVASAPLVAGLWAWWLVRRWRGPARPLPRTALVAAAAVYGLVLVAFTVYRNTAWGAAWYAGR